VTEEPIETIEYDDIPDTAEELSPPEGPTYHTLLEIWRAVLEPATKGEMVKEQVSPQWATKMVSTYPGLSFADTQQIHLRIFTMAAELAGIVQEEIDADSDCLTYDNADDDRENNSEHYKNVLTGWQVYLLLKELDWSPVDDDAAIQLAAMSEVHNMFLGQNGLVAHLDQIKFEFTEADQAELGEALQEARNGARAQSEGEDE
jgi:hypothetical protein